MKIPMIVFLATFLSMLTACGEDSSNGEAEDTLRERVEAWYLKDDRSGVSGGQCAISCHTTVPFMLMSPMQSVEDRATADGFKQIVAKRVTDWDSLQPLYSWAPEDSRSTEAVLNVVTLLEYDRKVNHGLSELSCKALENLWPLQQDDGHFLWLNASLSPWEDEYAAYYSSSLLAVALAHMSKQLVGQMSATDCSVWGSQSENVKALNRYLQNGYESANKHGQVWYLWANQELDYQLSNVQEHENRVSALLELQRADGGFDLKEFGPFVSNANSPAMSQPYITGLMIKALGSPDFNQGRQSMIKAEAFMKSYQYGDISRLQSLNKPSNERNNGFFQDANLAFYLGLTE